MMIMKFKYNLRHEFYVMLRYTTLSELQQSKCAGVANRSRTLSGRSNKTHLNSQYSLARRTTSHTPKSSNLNHWSLVVVAEKKI